MLPTTGKCWSIIIDVQDGDVDNSCHIVYDTCVVDRDHVRRNNLQTWQQQIFTVDNPQILTQIEFVNKKL